MQDIFTFLQVHWQLSLALIIVLFVLMVLEFFKQKSGAMRLTPTQVTQYINHKKAVIFDIRNSDAFVNGHIIGSISIPLKDLEDKQKKIEKYKSDPIIIVCGNGTESPKAATLLSQKGFHVHLLEGGLKAWRDADLPLVKD